MKEELLFNFREYEIDRDFDGKPHAFTKAFWNGKEREFALALVDGYVRFCEVDKLESGEWNFAVSSLIPNFSTHRVHMPFAENIFQTALERNDVGRLFYFATNETGGMKYSGDCPKSRHRVFIGLEKSGFIKCDGEPTRFRISTQLSITGNSYSDWYSELVRQAVNVESDFHFSYEWHQLRDIEKGLKVTQTTNGTRTKMERIANLILSLDDNLIQEDDYKRPLHAVFKLGTEDKPTVLKAVYLCFWNDIDTPDFYPESPLWEIFLRYFEPRIDTGICKKYSAPDTTEEYLLTFDRWDCELTAHEQIEGRTELSEWLQGQVPDDQIDLLLA